MFAKGLYVSGESVVSKNANTVQARPRSNPQELFPHQVAAMGRLDELNRASSFSSLLVLPTGGGKTRTAVQWLIANALQEGDADGGGVGPRRKVLWLAHRHLLLEQAADAFERNVFSDDAPNLTPFRYRIVSGRHDQPVRITRDDDVVIASKDSLASSAGLAALDAWLAGEDEVFVVVDEAHHAPARSYRRILDRVHSRVPRVKLLGLTATPFRTLEQEQGLLGEIFKNDVVYKADLQDLITKGILATPHPESLETKVDFGGSLVPKNVRTIERSDYIPQDMQDMMVEHSRRNRFIAQTYAKHVDRYGPTIVFAVNIPHAIALRRVFEEEGVRAGAIFSGKRTEFTNIDVSNHDNAEEIRKYERGDLDVLINVGILTEGADLPRTKTVFLTRPTVSSVLMTQMIGRALRGEKAGGTRDAHIVSFIDDWHGKVAWESPESVIAAANGILQESVAQRRDYDMRLVSIEKMEEFASILNEAVDTTALEGIEFIKRVPLGMYIFSLTIPTNGEGDANEGELEHNHQILVYDNSKHMYQALIDSLPALFTDWGLEEETIPEDVLELLVDHCREAYFDEGMIPPLRERDIEYLLRYYAQKVAQPVFVTFDEIERSKVDLSRMARKIFDEDMRPSEQKRYRDRLWEDPASLLKVYYGRKPYFRSQLDTEIAKLQGDSPTLVESTVVPDQVALEDLALSDWAEYAPQLYNQTKDAVFNRAKQGSEYVCAGCGKRSPYRALFHIDHVYPRSRGGKTTEVNLQLLCRPCNLAKGDRT